MHSEKNLEISWKICICFVCQSYYRTRRLGVVRGSDFLEKIHQICWFSGCDFHLPNKKSSADLHSEKNLGKFWRFCIFFLSFKLKRWQSHELTNQGYWIALEMVLKLMILVVAFAAGRAVALIADTQPELGCTTATTTTATQYGFATVTYWWAMMSGDEWWGVMRSDEEWYWVTMSDDEWWWVMMSNDEWWWVMNADDADDGCWWSKKLYKQTAELPINRPTGAEY